jgi:hypothetical protein
VGAAMTQAHPMDAVDAAGAPAAPHVIDLEDSHPKIRRPPTWERPIIEIRPSDDVEAMSKAAFHNVTVLQGTLVETQKRTAAVDLQNALRRALGQPSGYPWSALGPGDGRIRDIAGDLVVELVNNARDEALDGLVATEKRKLEASVASGEEARRQMYLAPKRQRPNDAVAVAPTQPRRGDAVARPPSAQGMLARQVRDLDLDDGLPLPPTRLLAPRTHQKARVFIDLCSDSDDELPVPVPKAPVGGANIYPPAWVDSDGDAEMADDGITYDTTIDDVYYDRATGMHVDDLEVLKNGFAAMQMGEVF